MVKCPRCGQTADRLYALPTAALRPAVRTANASPGDSQGCRWCRQELLEE